MRDVAVRTVAPPGGGTVRSLALCAGVGGLDLGVAAALQRIGLRHRLVGVVERQAHCAAILVARMADASLDTAVHHQWLGDAQPVPVTAGDRR